MEHAPITIALRLGCTGTSGRQIYSGVFDYIRTHAPYWSTVMTPFESASLPASGCIVDRAHAGEIPRLAHEGVPMVALDIDEGLQPKSGATIVNVRLDNRAIGRLAAAHFAETGPFRSYLFVHGPDKPEWSVLREREFRRSVVRKDAVYVELPHPSQDPLGRLLRNLTGQPRRAAVFCAHDLCATNVLGVCKSAGLKVPDDVAVLGVDNDTFLCDYSAPSLSSIEPDFEREGYLAAQELDRLLSRPRRPARRVPLVPIRGIVVRSSTRSAYSVDSLVQTGLDFIRNGFHKRISVLSVAHAMGMSRRLAELRFRQVKGTSIGAAITDVRLKHVQHLLKTTRMSMSEIARDSGFASANYLTRVFRKHLGQPPLAWSRARKAGRVQSATGNHL